MKNYHIKNIVFILIGFLSCEINAGNTSNLPFDSQPKQQIKFTENKGQVSDQNYQPRTDVLFSGSVNGMDYHLRNNGISYQLNRIDTWKEEEDHKTKQKQKLADQITIYRLDINWLGINTNFSTKTENVLEGYNNYYLEVCPNGISNVKTYKGIFYNNIYNGIDLHYYQKNNTLKYDYIVAPGANYKEIQLEIKGTNEIELQKDGSLFFITPLGKIHEGAPLVYQNNKQLKAKWVFKKNILSFDISDYDPRLELIIDPAVRVWGTYYGGTSYEQGNSVATDINSNVYSSGYTNSTNNIATTGAHQTTFSNSYDAFLVQFNSNGVRQWATYYGGGGDDRAYSCIADPVGNTYMCGYTSSGSGTVIATPGSHQPVFGGVQDAFLVKFGVNGTRLWGTYYGGTGANEYAQGCATDASGNVFMVGYTDSNVGTVIATPGSHQPIAGGSYDGFLVKFDPNGVRQWGTYYGGGGVDYAQACNVDPAGKIYVVGVTSTTGGTSIATPGSHQPTSTGSWDSFIVQFDFGGVRQWATYYGGPGIHDYGYGCVIDATGNVYMAGTTSCNTGTFIATTGSHQSTFGGALDGFLVKFNSLGVRQWGTYYGDTGQEFGNFCSIDLNGYIYITGYSDPGTNNLIASPGSYQPISGGGADIFLAKFNSAGVRQWGTYYGGINTEVAYSCCNDAQGNLYFSGYSSTTSGTVITSPGSHQQFFGGGSIDAVIVKFCNAPDPPLNTSPIANQFICANSSTTLFASGTATLSWYNSPTGGAYLGGGSSYITPTLVTTTTYYVQDSSVCSVNFRTPITVTVNPNPTISVSSGSICEGGSFTLNPTGAINYTYSSGAPVVSPTVTSTYSIIGTSSVGCMGTNTAVATVSVNAIPLISVNSGTICSGQSFTMLPTGANTYTFSSGSAIVSPTINAFYSVVGTSSFGCVSSNPALSYITVNSLPVITANSTPTLICPGETVSLTAIGALTYTWNTAAMNDTILVSPLVTTSYTVNGTDLNTCNNSAVISVSVLPAPAINIINSNSVICEGQSATLTANGADTYTWNTTSTNTTIVVSPTINTTYSVTGTNVFGCTASVINNVTVNTLPIISVNSGTICSGNSFTIIPNGANTYTYEGGSAIITPTATASYTVVGTSTAGCISASFATSNIMVNTTPTLAISLSPLSGSICPPPTASPAFFNVSGANTYTWMPGSFVSSSPIVQPPVSTNYTVTGTALNGCTTTSTQFLFVHPQPILGVILPTLACNGNTACFNTGGDLIFFSWNGPCGDASSQPNPCLMANTSCGSTYTVGGSNANGCIATTTVNIIVNPSPTVSAVSNTGLICAGQTATITASGANTYIWNTTATTQVIAVSPTITTSYTVTGTNSSGCTDLAIITQSVSACTGIQNLNSIKQNIKLYPNPTSSNFIIELETINAETKIEIINSLGQIVLVEPLTDIKSSVSMESFCNGIYFLKIISDNKTILNSKVVKE